MLLAGADKVSINTAAAINPSLIEESADKFGSQHLSLQGLLYRRDKGIPGKTENTNTNLI